MKDSRKNDVAGVRLESALVVRVREDVCEIVKDRRLYSVRYATQFPSPRIERVSPGHLVALGTASDGTGVVVWRWYDAVVLGAENGLIRMWEPSHGEVLAQPRSAHQRQEVGTRAYLSAGLPGADWWVAGRATANAEDAAVELDEVKRLYTERDVALSTRLRAVRQRTSFILGAEVIVRRGTRRVGRIVCFIMRGHAIVVTTALMAAAMVVLAAVTSCASKPVTTPSAGSASNAVRIVGYRWLLTGVSTTRSHMAIPGSFAAAIQFTADGKYLASDSLNAISGAYTSTKSGFSVHDSASTAVGYIGKNPQRLAAIAGIDAITGELAGHVSVTVTEANAPSTVLMTVPGYTLSFRRAGRAATFAPPSPTSTST